ncbi:MAG: NAD-dependent epimerase/dehydratase family protein, partial [Candidatus Kapaibacterium sp.]
MKVLITGGSGFIGTNIHEFIGTHYPNYQLINVDIVKPKVNFSHSAWEECDILNKEKLES